MNPEGSHRRKRRKRRGRLIHIARRSGTLTRVGLRENLVGCKGYFLTGPYLARACPKTAPWRLCPILCRNLCRTNRSICWYFDKVSDKVSDKVFPDSFLGQALPNRLKSR